MGSIVIARFWPVIIGVSGISCVLLLSWVKTKYPGAKHRRRTSDHSPVN